jgi:hypothetical protein
MLEFPDCVKHQLYKCTSNYAGSAQTSDGGPVWRRVQPHPEMNWLLYSGLADYRVLHSRGVACDVYSLTALTANSVVAQVVLYSCLSAERSGSLQVLL